MMRIGVQSKGILDDEMSDLESGFDKIQAAGFDCIDLNLDTFLKNSEIYEGKINLFFDQSAEQLRDYFMPYRAGSIAHDLQFSQMHAPYPVRVSGREGQNHYMRSEVIPKSLMVAGFLEIPYVVIHPFKMQYQCSSEEEYRQNMEYFKSLIPMARENHVIICLENLYESMGGRLVEGVCADPDEAV
ncbi:MAG: sugar phosphate isomerase/epimerase, partial [Hungatella sp.]